MRRKIMGCITVGFVLLGCVVGASAQQPDNAKVTEFLGYVFAGNLDAVKNMVANGMDVNAQAPSGFFKTGVTALHIAAYQGSLAMTNFLLSAGTWASIKSADGATPLHEAAKQGHAAIATAILKAGSGVFTYLVKDAQGRTPLHLAVVSDGDTVRVLLEIGSSIHAKNNAGQTPLQYGQSKTNAKGLAALSAFLNFMDSMFLTAAGSGDTNKLLRLTLNGVDVNIQAGPRSNFIRGLTALHVAAGYNQLDTVHLLLRRGADLSITDSDGKTPLHRAIEKGHAAIVTALLDNGSNVHTADNDGKTSLHRAVEKGHTAIVTALLNNGANVHAVDSDNKTPQQLAHQEGHASLAAHLLAFAQALPKRLWDAVRNSDATLIGRLIRNGADVNARDGDGQTPLMLAASTDRPAAVSALLKGGANVNATNSIGSTALHLAALSGRARVVPLLLSGGADVNAKGAQHHTPLHNAARIGHIEIVKALLDAGADTDAKTTGGWTAQQLALEWGHRDIVPLLGDYVPHPPDKLWAAIKAGDLAEIKRQIRLGADVNVKIGDNLPALHLAVMQTNVNLKILHSLLVAGADATKGVYQGFAYDWSALHYATVRGDLAAAELLLAYQDYGDATLVAHQSLHGDTALHYAAEAGDRDMVELLVAYWPDVLDRGGAAQIDPKNPPVRESSFPNNSGKTPRQLALDEGYADVAKALNGLEAFNRNADFHRAVADSDDPALIEALLDQGASVETRSNLIANTPLHTAVLANRPAVARFLLVEGASTEARNAMGETPLHYAALTANASMTAILLEAGAETDVQNVQGKTPLHYATSTGAEGVRQQLLDAGADATIEDWDGNTP